jgi:hypothetical protein
MSEREYLSLRYAVPGFTLILIVLGTNSVPLLNAMSDKGLSSVLGAVLTFLATGSAIGFLISQFWYVRLFWEDSAFLGELVRMQSILKGKVDFNYEKAGRNNDERLRTLNVVMDHIAFSKDKEIYQYVQRRCDLYHTMSSTSLAIVLGLKFGFLTRILLGVPGFNMPFWQVCHPAEYLIFTFVTIASLCLLYIIWKGRQNIWHEIDLWWVGLATTADKKKLKEFFPDFFD